MWKQQRAASEALATERAGNIQGRAVGRSGRTVKDCAFERSTVSR
jgi:hypothetical protein